MTYILLNTLVLSASIAFLAVARKLIWTSAMARTLTVLIIATAIFDSIIVGVGIVAYDEAKILGLRVIRAPIEDFFYTLLAGIIIPTVWHWRRDNDRQS